MQYITKVNEPNFHHINTPVNISAASKFKSSKKSEILKKVKEAFYADTRLSLHFSRMRKSSNDGHT